MAITKCEKQCIFVNMLGFCCLDGANITRTEPLCQQGQDTYSKLERGTQCQEQ